MKYNFGDYALMGAVTYNFEKAPGWYWKIKPVTSGIELEMSRFLYRNRDVEANGKSQYIPPLNLEICHREIALLFGGTNIPEDAENPVEYGGKPILPEGANVEQVEAVLRQMPKEMVLEIWTAIARANPDGKWGPELPKETASQPEQNSDSSGS